MRNDICMIYRCPNLHTALLAQVTDRSFPYRDSCIQTAVIPPTKAFKKNGKILLGVFKIFSQNDSVFGLGR